MKAGQLVVARHELRGASGNLRCQRGAVLRVKKICRLPGFVVVEVANFNFDGYEFSTTFDELRPLTKKEIGAR